MGGGNVRPQLFFRNMNIGMVVGRDLHEYLLAHDMVDKHLPECPDVEQKWEETAMAYLPDGIREFNEFPTASLGWMMFVGMAIAHMWDSDWQRYGGCSDLYQQLREARGYDCLDDHVMEDVLHLDEQECNKLSRIVGECAGRTLSELMHSQTEPGTQEAFKAYAACLKQLYLMGMAMELKRLGYHMHKL